MKRFKQEIRSPAWAALGKKAGRWEWGRWGHTWLGPRRRFGRALCFFYFVLPRIPSCSTYRHSQRGLKGVNAIFTDRVDEYRVRTPPPPTLLLLTSSPGGEGLVYRFWGITSSPVKKPFFGLPGQLMNTVGRPPTGTVNGVSPLTAD